LFKNTNTTNGQGELGHSPGDNLLQKTGSTIHAGSAIIYNACLKYLLATHKQKPSEVLLNFYAVANCIRFISSKFAQLDVICAHVVNNPSCTQ
jgi:hypothetical protein